MTVTGIVTENAWNDSDYFQTEDGGFISRDFLSEDPPPNVQLDVENILQNPHLPNGCEMTMLFYNPKKSIS